jgi:predicted nucleotidyltransferase
MNRDAVIAALCVHEPELKAAGVVRLSLFGSTSRDAACPGSDIGNYSPPTPRSP